MKLRNDDRKTLLIGAILVIGAGVLLVTRRRMNAD